MLAIQTNTKISLITDLRLYQVKDRFLIYYNNSDVFKGYDTKEEAMTDFIKMSGELKKEKLVIVKKDDEE